MTTIIKIRKDRGWQPLIVFAIVGFLLGVGAIFIVAIHNMWDGGQFRHYSYSLYFLAGLFGAFVVEIVGNVFAWAFNVVEEEYLDGE